MLEREQMIRLISLDLDGTLLDPSGAVTPAAKAAIAKARAAGIRVVLNTGRPIPEAFWFAQKAGCDDLLCALGGAALADREAGRIIRRWDIGQDSGRRVLELCLNREIELMIFAGDQILVDPFSKRSLEKTYPFPVFHRHAIVTEDPLAYLEEHKLPLTKLHGDQNPGRYPLGELAALPGIELTASNDHDFELVAAGVNKGRALALLSMMYGIPLCDCAAVGDSDNDLAMLRVVGTPIAMGNASRSVQDAACRVVPSNEEEGVSQAILSCLDSTFSLHT